MARPRKPTELKLLKGTARPCRMNPDEPDQSSGLPVAPSHLGTIAREHFDILVKRIDDMGYASDSFTEVLALASEAFETWQLCNAVIAEIGMVGLIPNSYGDIVRKENPEVAIRQKAWQTYRMCLVEMGLTPASKSKVSAKKKEPEKKGKWAL